MRTLAILCLLVAICFAESERVITKQMTEELAKFASWKVVDYEDNVFKDWTRDDLLSYFGYAEIGPVTTDANEEQLVSDALPDHFDCREKWGNCIHAIRNQGRCGSCWAHGSTEALSDRFCIKGRDVNLAPQDLVSCDKTSSACGGGMLVGAYTYMEKFGAVAEACFPYVSANENVPACPSKCPSGAPWVKYHCKAGSVVTITNDIEKMKNAIYNGGPITTRCDMYEDLLYYKGGIYSHKAGRLVTGHIIKTIGWGSEGGVNYWVIANSWGNAWGEHGFMKFKMNDCDVNHWMVYCDPQL